MIYSVWNQAVRAYDYFEAGGSEARVNAPTPKHLRPSRLGATLQAAAWPLPVGAQHVGRGQFARGRVAVHSTGALSGVGGIDLGDPIMLGLLGLAAYVYWRSTRRRSA